MDPKKGKQILQTAASLSLNEKAGNDDSPISHGTAVASKAAGKLFGVAKAVCFSTPTKVGGSSGMRFRLLPPGYPPSRPKS